MLIKVFCVLCRLPPAVCFLFCFVWGGGGGGGGATGLLNKGGGSNRLPVEFPQVQTSLYNITLSRRRPTTVRSNDTLGNTPFQLISDFFHVNQGVQCFEHASKAEEASSRGVMEGGGQQAC